jgi:hypothetical protein
VKGASEPPPCAERNIPKQLENRVVLLRRIGHDPVLALNAKPQEHTVESEIHDSLLAERVSNGRNDLDHRKDPLRDDWGSST